MVFGSNVARFGFIAFRISSFIDPDNFDSCFWFIRLHDSSTWIRLRTNCPEVVESLKTGRSNVFLRSSSICCITLMVCKETWSFCGRISYPMFSNVLLMKQHILALRLSWFLATDWSFVSPWRCVLPTSGQHQSITHSYQCSLLFYRGWYFMRSSWEYVWNILKHKLRPCELRWANVGCGGGSSLLLIINFNCPFLMLETNKKNTSYYWQNIYKHPFAEWDTKFSR